MNKNLTYDFSVDKENKKITMKREFAAALPLVWDAYTKSELLDQWWAPKPWKARTKSMDFREGGKWIYAMVGPKGEEHWSFANYMHVEPQKKYTVVDGFSDAEGHVNTSMPQSRWDVTFTPKGDHTLVDIQISYKSLEELQTIISMGFKEGVSLAMEGLDELLPSLQGKRA
jgi:uncharacterized protein YndB with AHSA1/START domain